VTGNVAAEVDDYALNVGIHVGSGGKGEGVDARVFCAEWCSYGQDEMETMYDEANAGIDLQTQFPCDMQVSQPFNIFF
jgi:hypothetical protein